MTSTSPSSRSPLVRGIDIAVGVVIALFGVVLGLGIVALYQQLTGLSAACDGIAADGTRCSPAFLATMTNLGIAIVVFGWGLTTGMLVVRLIQKRLVWYWPLIGLAVLVASFYLISLVLGSSYLPPSS